MRLFVGLAGVMVLAAAGCGGTPANQLPVNTARGQVFVDGQPAEGAEVVFIPLGQRNEHTGNSIAYVQNDGSFVLGTYTADDGIPEGEYKVAIYWNPAFKDTGAENVVRPPNRLPGKVGDPAKTQEKRTITRGPNDIPKFDLKSVK